VVSADRLTAYLWGEDEPGSATSSLYNQVTRLRQALGAGGRRVEAVAPGYVIRTDPGDLDLRAFEDHCAAGRHALAGRDWLRAEERWVDALALWRGDPFADVPALADHPLVHHLHEARLQALQGRVEAALNLGRHGHVVGELRALTVAHPLREAFHAQLMLALYRDGRQAEALEAFHALRQALVGELGIEPSGETRDLQQRILTNDPALAGPASLGATTVPAARPAQGRVPLEGFRCTTGR
jgi:DNA-binding SARP family transcriptional activator